MACVLGRELLSHEDMAEMPTAVFAEDLNPKTVGVGLLRDRTRDFVVEAGPPAVTGEFILGTIQRRVATPADIGAGVGQLGVFADERSFRILPQDYPRFFRRETG